MLKTNAVVDTFLNSVKQSLPDLTEEDYNKAIEDYKGKKWLEVKKEKHGKDQSVWVMK
ncbi:MAG: hypothetical protein AB7J34_09020 [Limisphaerales bacterium]